jgi:hypothetical protein
MASTLISYVAAIAPVVGLIDGIPLFQNTMGLFKCRLGLYVPINDYSTCLDSFGIF